MVSPRRQLMLATVVQVEQVLVEVEVLALMALAPAMHRVLVAQVEKNQAQDATQVVVVVGFLMEWQVDPLQQLHRP